jgi:hypothetical protein
MNWVPVVFIDLARREVVTLATVGAPPSALVTSMHGNPAIHEALAT